MSVRSSQVGAMGAVLVGASAIAYAGGGSGGGGGGGAPAGIEISFYSDPVLDCVFRCSDHDQNGNYNQGGETVVLYADQVASPLVANVALSDPRAITVSPDDTVFVGDVGERIVLALNDYDENGTANEAGEHWIYFDGRSGGNFAGIELPYVTGVTNRAALGVLWVSVKNTNSGESDTILRLVDQNLDLDANDFGEARVYCTLPESIVSGALPIGIREGVDGAVYVLDAGDQTPSGRGIYRLEDVDNSGVIDQPGELTAFFVPAGPTNAEWVALDQDDAENWYLLDRANGEVWRGHDTDGNGVVDSTESGPFWAFSSVVDCVDLAATDEGGIFVGDLGSPNLLHFAEDFDTDGVIGSGESLVAYDDTVAPVDMDAPVGVAVDFHQHNEVGDAFCTSASIVGCPCNNAAISGEGCANSTGVGALLEGEGSSGIGNDDLELHVHQLPSGAAAIAFAGFQQVNNGNGQRFYDGLRCVGGPLLRLGVVQADASGFAAWGPGLAAAQPLLVVGVTAHFQAWYRDPSGPCGTTANFSNGLSVTFDP